MSALGYEKSVTIGSDTKMQIGVILPDMNGTNSQKMSSK